MRLQRLIWLAAFATLIASAGLRAQAPSDPTTIDQQLRRTLGATQRQLGSANRQLGACSGDLLDLQGQLTAGELVSPATVDAANRESFEKANPGKSLDKNWKIIDKPKADPAPDHPSAAGGS